MHNLLYFAVCYYNMSKAGAFRFREPKTVAEEEELVDKSIPSSNVGGAVASWLVRSFPDRAVQGHCVVFLGQTLYSHSASLCVASYSESDATLKRRMELND